MIWKRWKDKKENILFALNTAIPEISASLSFISGGNLPFIAWDPFLGSGPSIEGGLTALSNMSTKELLTKYNIIIKKTRMHKSSDIHSAIKFSKSSIAFSSAVVFGPTLGPSDPCVAAVSCKND